MCVCFFWSLFCCVVPCVLYSFAIILLRKRELGALLKLASWCLVPVSVQGTFLPEPWAGLQCVIGVFPGHTHVLITLLYV